MQHPLLINILRRFSPVVEESSIDEAYADITGLRQLYRTSYEKIALKIQKEVLRELNINVSIGLSLSKSLAKLCSKFRKPVGFTGLQGKHIHTFLQITPLENVCGFGPSTSALLRKLGLRSAYDFAVRPERWAGKLLHKPGREIWNELRGNSMWEVTSEEKPIHTTILKSRTFTPPTNNRSFIYAKLIRNVEAAFIKLRRHKLRALAIGIVLRRSDFEHTGLEARLNRATSSPIEAIPLVRRLFDKVFQSGCQYRASMVVLGRLESSTTDQLELFEDRLKIDAIQSVTRAMDDINERFGRHTLCSATSLFLKNKPCSPRDELPARNGLTMTNEDRRKRIAIPRMDIKV